MKKLNIIKQKGYRLTKTRENVIKALKNHPLTVEEISENLKKNKININTASIYRSLELFVETGIAHTFNLGEGKSRYELVNENYHHHHLICNNCKNIEDIVLDRENFTKEINRKSKFKIDHHHLEFFGLCKRCQ